MTARLKMLATVHIARKQMGWDDTTYRSIVMRKVGKHSSGDCTDAQLGVLLDEFRRLGWQQMPKKRKPSVDPLVRKIYAIWGDIKPLLDGAADDTALRGFVARQTRTARRPDGISAPEFLDTKDAHKVIEGMKGWLMGLENRASSVSGGENS